jgi:hypothetical protein
MLNACYKIIAGRFKGKVGMAQHAFVCSATAPILDLLVFEDDRWDFNHYSFFGKFSILREASERDENYFRRHYQEYITE